MSVIADVGIRLATSADAADIAHMSRECIEDGLPWKWRPERVLRAIRSADTNVAVVRRQQALVAFGVMTYAEEDAHLLLFAVHPQQRRQGVGSAVLLWLEDVARAAGARRIRVETPRSNEAARCFYSEHGYHERTIQRRMYYDVLDGIRLEKWLARG